MTFKIISPSPLAPQLPAYPSRPHVLSGLLCPSFILFCVLLILTMLSLMLKNHLMNDFMKKKLDINKTQIKSKNLVE